MGRLEYKYLVPVEKLPELRRAFLPFIEMDEYMPSETGEYSVHSIYFDTLSLNCYYEKLADIQHRKKIRVRGYNNQSGDSLIFLEIKHKKNKSVTKNRASFLFRNMEALFNSRDIGRFIKNGDGTSRAYEDARLFFYQIGRHSLFPVINIHYEREAYFCRFNKSLRITFDKNIRSTAYPDIKDLFKEDRILYSKRGFCVLEVKFHDFSGDVPGWIGEILERFDLKKTSVSKYTISLDTHQIPKCSASYLISKFVYTG
ncbi:polyphosphate polymerase domain-containing protein [bacterium]|nr:polyphosphate polymerase domain-containing protein [bacterium]